MSTITTDDCKRKLVELYPATQVKSWKRTKKYLNDQKQWERVFECTAPSQARTVVLQERSGELFEVPPKTEPNPVHTALDLATPTQHAPAEASIPLGLQALPDDLIAITVSADMNRMLFGASSAEPLGIAFSTPNPQELSFLLVLQNTIDWNAPEKERSSYDFAKTIDFKTFAARCTVQGIDLLGSYLAYMEHQLGHLAGLDEDNFLDIGATDYDDSVADLVDVLQRIRQAFVEHKWHAPLAGDALPGIAEMTGMLKDVGEAVYGSTDPQAHAAFAILATVESLFSNA